MILDARALLLTSILAPACASAPPVRSGPDEDTRAVVQAVDAMFAAMRTHDAEGLRESLIEGAIIVHVGEKPGEGVRHEVVSDTEFIESISTADHEIDERFTEPPLVRIQGSIATLWGPYEVFVGGERHHCGVDAVSLARLEGQWRVTAITYTARACE